MLQQNAKSLSGMDRVLHLALSVFALILSWLVIQTVFAFRYAHRYYGMGGKDEDVACVPPKGFCTSRCWSK